MKTFLPNELGTENSKNCFASAFGEFMMIFAKYEGTFLTKVQAKTAEDRTKNYLHFSAFFLLDLMVKNPLGKFLVHPWTYIHRYIQADGRSGL